MPARRFRITGRVQGVFFRAAAKEQADRLGIRGWVKNTSDGSVEIHAEGSDEPLKALEAWCREGPPAADVSAVFVEQCAEEGQKNFSVEA